MAKTAYLIVNFGGPRSVEETEPFLRALLTDKDVIPTHFPQPLHNFLFRRVAKKRAEKVVEDYGKIGGSSPIWSDTEYIANELKRKLKADVLTFHRYLPSTHASFIESLKQLDCETVQVFPLFPQFTFATTGSIARFFLKAFPPPLIQKMRWVKSYPTHPAFIKVTQNALLEFLDHKGLKEEQIFFLFSAHGLPKKFIERGDLYAYECEASFNAVMKGFSKAKGLLCYQSQFGKEEWLRPYTVDVCGQIEKYAKERRHCVFVPLSFTSDHIETLFEVEQQYMPLIQKQGLYSFRAPALNRRPDWIDAIVEILSTSTPCTASMMIK